MGFCVVNDRSCFQEQISADWRLILQQQHFENHYPMYTLVSDKLQAPVATFSTVRDFLLSLSSLCSLIFVKLIGS